MMCTGVHREGGRVATNEGPLAGLRVIEVSGELGRFAGKILSESGASVARIGHVTSGPAMAAVEGGLLDWWLEGGKQFVDVELDSDAGVATYRRLAASADLVIDTTAPGRLADLGVGAGAYYALTYIGIFVTIAVLVGWVVYENRRLLKYVANKRAAG